MEKGCTALASEFGIPKAYRANQRKTSDVGAQNNKTAPRPTACDATARPATKTHGLGCSVRLRDPLLQFKPTLLGYAQLFVDGCSLIVQTQSFLGVGFLKQFGVELFCLFVEASNLPLHISDFFLQLSLIALCGAVILFGYSAALMLLGFPGLEQTFALINFLIHRVQVGVVVADVVLGSPVADFDHGRGHALHEVAVVGGENDRASVDQQGLHKGFGGFHIKVVAGFVEHQNVVGAEQESGETEPRALPAREDRDLLLDV